MKHKYTYILIAFILFELITGGGLLIIRTVFPTRHHKEISNEMDKEVYVNFSFDFPQKIYYIPFLATVSSWKEPGGMLVTFSLVNQASDEQSGFFNEIKSVRVIKMIITDDLGNQSVHPVQFETAFGKKTPYFGGEPMPNSPDKSFVSPNYLYSNRTYDIQLFGQAIYVDGSKKDFIVKKRFGYEKSYLFGINWLLLSAS